MRKIVKGIALCAVLAAVASFVSCSNTSSSDDVTSAGTVFEYDIKNDITLKTGYKYDENAGKEVEDEAHYDGVMVKLSGLLDPAKMTKGTKCKFTLKGSVNKNFEYVNAKESDKPQMTLQIVDTSEEASWWKALSQKEVDLVETDGKIDLTWEFTLDESAVTKDKSKLIIFLKVIENPTFAAENSMKVTVTATPTEETKSAEETKSESLGLSSMDGWGSYTISEKADDKVTVSHTTALSQYACCGADIKFGTANKVTFTVTNNADAEAWIQIQVKKDTESVPAISSATIDGESCESVEWGAATTIPAKGSKKFVLNIDNTKDADKFVVSLNSNKEAGNPANGNITISEAYIYGK